jgi:transposase
VAELLRADMLSPVYHGEKSALEVQHQARSYALPTEDTTRAMARIKAVFRGQAIACAGKKLYGPKHRGEYLVELGSGALRRRAEFLYRELETVQQLRRQAKRDMIVECRKYPETKLLCSAPFLGPVRAAVPIGRVQTPHRFRTKRQFWAYCGLALEMRDSGEYRMVDGQVERRKRPAQIRGLNWNHNHELKNLFKAAATTAVIRMECFGSFILVC